ncbi:MAG: DUF4153 domain-containing protein [Saprospiraceae bacterium]
MSRFNLSQILNSQINIIKVVLKRFYLVAFSAILLTSLLLYFSEYENTLSDDSESLITRLCLITALAIPFFFSLHLFAEKNKFNITKYLIAILLISSILAAYWFSLANLGDFVWYNKSAAIRFGALFLAAHGAISISVFNRYSQIDSFWQFNKHLLLRMLTGVFYSGVLFLGIAAAFAAMDALFNVNIESTTYLQVFIILSCLYNTFFVLGGVKAPLATYEASTEYPNSLKIFTQFVLIPLMLLYLVILYAYMLKIIVLWSLPKGWVSNLVLCYSIAGILAFLLVYPIREEINSKWVKTYSRVFYFALLPLIVLLHISIWTRVADYGITIERYIICVLSLWLTGITAYFLISKKDNIILIPMSLAAIFLLSTFGPLGFEGLSKYSQFSRLKSELQAMDIWDGNKITPMPKGAVFNDSIAFKVNDISSYLIEMNGYNYMNKFNYGPWNKLTDSLNNSKDLYFYSISGLYLNKINLDPSKIKWTPYSDPQYIQNTSFYLSVNDLNSSYAIKGYESMYSLNIYENPNGVKLDSLIIGLQANKINIKFGSNDIKPIDLAPSIQPLIYDCRNGCPPLTKPIVIDYSDKGLNFRILIINLSGDNKDNLLKINSVNGYLLIK